MASATTRNGSRQRGHVTQLDEHQCAEQKPHDHACHMESARESRWLRPILTSNLGTQKTHETPDSQPRADQVQNAVVTMDCGETCPIYPGKRYLDWELPDPAGKSLQEVRPIRDRDRQACPGVLGEIAPVSR